MVGQMQDNGILSSISQKKLPKKCLGISFENYKLEMKMDKKEKNELMSPEEMKMNKKLIDRIQLMEAEGSTGYIPLNAPF
jgi:hypothetical protein